MVHNDKGNYVLYSEPTDIYFDDASPCIGKPCLL